VTRETISLYVLEGNERVCVERLESNKTCASWPGWEEGFRCMRGLLAKSFWLSSPCRRDAILKATPPTPITASTIVDIRALMDELKRIRKKGYAVSFGEWVPRLRGAAPIFDAREWSRQL